MLNPIFKSLIKWNKINTRISQTSNLFFSKIFFEMLYSLKFFTARNASLAILDAGWSGGLLINHLPHITPISFTDSRHFDKGATDSTSTAY